jgi:hypothetical protein
MLGRKRYQARMCAGQSLCTVTEIQDEEREQKSQQQAHADVPPHRTWEKPGGDRLKINIDGAFRASEIAEGNR